MVPFLFAWLLFCPMLMWGATKCIEVGEKEEGVRQFGLSCHQHEGDTQLCPSFIKTWRDGFSALYLAEIWPWMRASWLKHKLGKISDACWQGKIPGDLEETAALICACLIGHFPSFVAEVCNPGRVLLDYLLLNDQLITKSAFFIDVWQGECNPFLWDEDLELSMLLPPPRLDYYVTVCSRISTSAECGCPFT